jgi:hypothetical protein
MITSSGVRARIARAKLSERRGDRRFRFASPDAQAQVVAVVGGHFWLAGIRDVSVSGISLMCPYQIQPDTLLTIELVNSTGEYTHTLLAWVRHIVPNSKGSGFVAGCSFPMELREDELQALLK